uniref:Uncharacterized protein n=1 Tax=Candidatus Kentrum sp. DK TaxID=2126562 RepID=A0A450S553_9GAMM|nr:MAG: hypothetical protein BECKDK2373C_GA0170839_100212 [Candidatus Kentron sp. DK]VFJ47016.1 MAG: hypothetical protein BECKDK2373B_GA0170837_10155 [Candidatus Kentron sp. DK]
MPFDPAILALLGASLTIACLLLPVTWFALDIARHWDLSSGSGRQLIRERRTYLVSTLLVLAFFTELASLVLFLHTIEGLAPQFVGAMCATGVLGVNPWGWPALFLKIAVFLAGAVWLMLNRLDNQGYDYPLTRIKYSLLLAVIPLVWAEAITQALFFLQMDRDVITSCCGSLFTPEDQSLAGDLSGLPPGGALVLFYLSGVAVLAVGGWYFHTGKNASPTPQRWRGGIGFAAAGALAFLTGLMAIVSVISPYIYQLPHHHCPFCILEAGHDFIGYWLYIPLFGATALALGAGVIAPCARIESLREVAIADTRRFVSLALILFLVFYGVATGMIMRSNLILFSSS